MKIYLVFALLLLISLGCRAHLGKKEDRLETSKIFIDYLYANDSANMIKMFPSEQVPFFLKEVSFLYRELHKYKKPSFEDYSIKEYPYGGYKRTTVTIPIFRAPNGDTISHYLSVDLVLIYGPLDVTPEGTIGRASVERKENPNSSDIRIPLSQYQN